MLRCRRRHRRWAPAAATFRRWIGGIDRLSLIGRIWGRVGLHNVGFAGWQHRVGRIIAWLLSDRSSWLIGTAWLRGGGCASGFTASQ